MKLVSMTLKHAQWLGMAAHVAGGCVAVGEEGRCAADVIGADVIGRVPDAWLPSPDYRELTINEIARVRLYLDGHCGGWSGAARVNRERDETAAMLFGGAR